MEAESSGKEKGGVTSQMERKQDGKYRGKGTKPY